MLIMDIKTALMELAEVVKRILNDRIKQYGIIQKRGTNTLEGSNLQQSIKVDIIEEGIALQIADYWEFVSRGWKRTGNYSGTFSQFVRNVDDWVRRKGIKFGDLTQSQIVWAVIKNIWNNGLRSRPFMVYDEEGDLEKMIPELNDYIDKWFDELFDAITNDLDKYFN